MTKLRRSVQTKPTAQLAADVSLKLVNLQREENHFAVLATLAILACCAVQKFS